MTVKPFSLSMNILRRAIALSLFVIALGAQMESVRAAPVAVLSLATARADQCPPPWRT
jgi:hypothetical protein